MGHSYLSLKKDEITKLGLGRKQSVDWWSRDHLPPVSGRVDFYYRQGFGKGKGLDNPLELNPIYPSCLLVRERMVKGDRTVSKSVRIEGLPEEISKLNFSYYHVGPCDEQYVDLDLSGSLSLRNIVECATITFLEKAVK